jgi:hypothetical protein
MLVELKGLHRELLAAIAALEALVAAAEPDRTRLPGIRAHLVNASARRRRWIDNHVYPHLLGHLPAQDGRLLEGLRSQNIELRELSLQHVNRWTVETIFRDWTGYRRAASAMTASMRQRIAAEQALLYPLLDRVPTRPPTSGWIGIANGLGARRAEQVH